ncbi:MAG: hypothetical protein C4527_07835 [Candidatus Omnitrophota bacterium]|jgi:4-hydroxy-2-oxoheptanedioate aldolase|nr:MAG: hypothetical protein C4527_07835 [Candidatus Omnitrophota bacterium]
MERENGMKRTVSLFLVFLCISCFTVTAEENHVHLNKIIAKLTRQEVVIGTWMQTMSIFSAMGLVESNGVHDAQTSLTTPMIDFVLIDMEHMPFDVETLTNLLMAFHSKREVMNKGNLQPNICPLVRIPCDAGGPIEPYIKQCLDAGAFGIVVPHCRNAADARRVVQACRYPQAKGDPQPEPAGVRGASPWPCSYLWGVSMDEYVRRADVWPLDPAGDILAVIMIEDQEGKNNIDEILSVPGVGAVIYGPYDYSFSCGVPGNVKAADVIKAGEEIAAACNRHNVPFVVFPTAENMAQLIEQGHKVFLVGSDVQPTALVSDVIEQAIKK